MAEKQKTSIFSKIFTIVYVIFLVVLLIFSYIYLAVTPDYVKPIIFKIDTNAYEYNIDEFAEFLNEKEYMQEEGYSELSVKGVTTARKYGDVSLLYWDTENMDKQSDEYKNWKKISNVGNMKLDDGSLIIVYGCFGVSYKEKASEEAEETYKLFEKFPAEYSGNHGNDTVWDYTFEEFIDYMCEIGHFKKDDCKMMSVIGTENWIYNGVDVMWWDVENLVENTEPANYWAEFQENGYILFGGMVYNPTFNGPFAINPTAAFPGDATKLIEDFMAFPSNYSKKHVNGAKTVESYTFGDSE